MFVQKILSNIIVLFWITCLLLYADNHHISSYYKVNITLTTYLPWYGRSRSESHEKSFGAKHLGVKSSPWLKTLTSPVTLLNVMHWKLQWHFHGKVLYSWPPWTNSFRSAHFYIENTIYLCYKTSYLNEEFNYIEPSPTISVPWHFDTFESKDEANLSVAQGSNLPCPITSDKRERTLKLCIN